MSSSIPFRAQIFSDCITLLGGEWSGDTLGDNRETHYQEEAIIQLPFPVCLGGYCSPVITVGTDGYIVYNDATTNSLVVLNAFTWQGSGLYIYPGANGVFYRIAGPVGARSLVFSWYAGTYEQGAEQNHFTITLFENAQVAQLKYYDVVQVQPQAFAYIQLGSFFLAPLPFTLPALHTHRAIFKEKGEREREKKKRKRKEEEQKAR